MPFSRKVSLRTRLAAIQAAITNPASVLFGPDSSQNSDTLVPRGNNYQSYERQVQLLRRMYLSQALYGSALAGLVINYRASTIAGNGFSASLPKDHPGTDWLNDLLQDNRLTGPRAFEWAVLGELEGKALINVTWDEMQKRVRFQHISWVAAQYSLEFDPADYENLQRISIHGASYDPDGMVFVQLDGILGDWFNTPPTAATVLQEIENLDRAKSDWRALNHLYGVTFPYWETSGPTGFQDAGRIIRTIEGQITASGAKQVWKPGHKMAAPAKFYYPGPPAEGRESIEREIAVNAKVVSGRSGVPINALGFVDLFGTKAGVEETAEAIYTSTAPQREKWESALREAIIKAAGVHASMAGQTFDMGDLQVTLQAVTKSQLQELVQVYVPLMDAGLISEQTVQGMIPGIDPEVERERIEDEKSERIKQNQETIKSGLRLVPGQDDTDETRAAGL